MEDNPDHTDFYEYDENNIDDSHHLLGWIHESTQLHNHENYYIDAPMPKHQQQMNTAKQTYRMHTETNETQTTTRKKRNHATLTGKKLHPPKKNSASSY